MNGSADVVEAIVREESDYWICDDFPPAFRVADIYGPAGAETHDDPAARALRDFLADYGRDLPQSGWRCLARTRREVVFGCRKDGSHCLVTVERNRDGGWDYATSASGVESFGAIRDRNPASPWRLDPDAPPPRPADTELHVRVTEIHCATGRSADGRIERPDVFYGDDEIRIVAYVTALPGDQKCPGNPSTPALFVLPEPIGDRRLVDAGEYRLR